MNLFILYLIAFVPSLIVAVPYIILKKLNKISDKANRILLYVFSGITLFVIIATIFSVSGAMVPDNGHNGFYSADKGNVFLTGVPYGTNKFLNFLAWLSVASFLPGGLIISLSGFYSNKTSKQINTFIVFPITALELCFLFNYINGFSNNFSLSYQNIFLALEVGLTFMLSLILFLRDLKESLTKDWKEIVYFIVFYLTVYFCSLPVNTFATLTNPSFKIFGGMSHTMRVLDFSQIHRIYLYIAIIIPLLIYFYNRNKDLNTKKVLMLAISLGVLSVFFDENGLNGIFHFGSDFRINVGNLPIHLCHTALFVLPLCIAFNLKKLFYFTYFINVFGAIMAMAMPNTGDDMHYLAPGVILFWYNHIAAYCMPLLAVALGIFEKPKMKQMFYSLAFFSAYMASIVFLNAWLSNYVDGYSPDKIGSGTDYLFVNGTFIVDKLWDSAFHILDVKLKWNWGSLVFVIYPIYQSVFFIGYAAIAFGMWFVYSLFYKIADSHIELHDQLVVMRKERITFKEKMKMAKIDNELIDHSIASLKFINFSKRYGNSSKLSADNVNLEVKAGEIFGFLGPNGAGKSTCIKTAIGVQPVTKGTIEVCGYNVSTQSVLSKKLIGYVPDHYALYEKLTGREYINYIANLYGVSKEDRDERISKYVDLFELNQAFDNRMQTYSHGMKQKMTIMAALVHNPKVWILDEPLTGLDPQSIYQVKEVMKEHAKAGNIVFFSSHIINVVEKLCTRIAIIKKGHIVYEADMKTVEKEHPEGLEEFYMNTIRDNGDFDE